MLAHPTQNGLRTSTCNCPRTFLRASRCSRMKSRRMQKLHTIKQEPLLAICARTLNMLLQFQNPRATQIGSNGYYSNTKKGIAYIMRQQKSSCCVRWESQRVWLLVLRRAPVSEQEKSVEGKRSQKNLVLTHTQCRRKTRMRGPRFTSPALAGWNSNPPRIRIRSTVPSPHRIRVIL